MGKETKNELYGKCKQQKFKNKDEKVESIEKYVNYVYGKSKKINEVIDTVTSSVVITVGLMYEGNIDECNKVVKDIKTSIKRINYLIGLEHNSLPYYLKVYKDAKTTKNQRPYIDLLAKRKKVARLESDLQNLLSSEDVSTSIGVLVSGAYKFVGHYNSTLEKDYRTSDNRKLIERLTKNAEYTHKSGNRYAMIELKKLNLYILQRVTSKLPIDESEIVKTTQKLRVYQGVLDALSEQIYLYNVDKKIKMC